MSLSHDEVVIRDFSQSAASKSSKGKWIAISIIVALVLGGAIIGCLFGLKVIGGSSSSSSDDASTHNGGDLGSTDPSSSSTADAIGGGSGSSSTSVASSTAMSTGASDSSSTGTFSSSTGTSSTSTTSTGTTSPSSTGSASTGSSTSPVSSTATSSTASASSSTATTSSSTASPYYPPAPSKLTYGTYYNPFAADSPWNSRPLDPVFDTYFIPPDYYFPAIQNGAYSTEMFYARASDPPNTVYGGSGGMSNPDIGGYSTITLPHWPAATEGASGSDGHADIYDETTGMVHSFWILRHNTTTDIWTAALYSWCYLNGTGWGDVPHYYQGPRATGVSSAAGLIRQHEINDGQPYFPHALTMSLTYNGLSRSPTYVFPATSADGSASYDNWGLIPEGALMMLPPSFNVSQLTGWPLRKVAETLKRYGAYVTDRNTGTPFVLYVENGGPGYRLSNVSGWDNQVAAEINLLRQSMRRVISATKWVDGYDQPRAPLTPGRPNMISMRGPWTKNYGPGIGGFDSWKQAVVFPYANISRTQVSATNGYGLRRTTWVSMQVNQTYIFTCHAQGGALLNMQIMVGGQTANQSGSLSDGQTWSFKWPNGGYVFFQAWSGINTSSQVWGEVRSVADVPYDMGMGRFVPPPQPSPAAATPFPDPPGLPKLNFGTYLTPFSVDSPWNSRPLNPVLEAPLIPIDNYGPAIQSGAYSTQIFYATAADPPNTVYPGSSKLSNPDIGGFSTITLPHWPAATEGASGSDGHCDIYDETSGKIHSFWILRHNTTTNIWTAALYSWTHINGTGWGDPAHYYQGPRATGISSGAGLIRNHEVDDGLPFFRHALTMSLTYSALTGPETGTPGYVFPATSSDGDLSRNYGNIPEGALLMLPPSFNVSALTGAPLRKVAETLKRYGAYVTDRNDGTPFVIYVENGGAGFKLSNVSGWDSTVAAELQLIRASLSRVLSATQWIDGNGKPRAPLAPGTPNLLSMRGPWDKQYGPGKGDFDSWQQALVFPYANTSVTSVKASNGRGIVGISWAKINPNMTLTYTVHATGGAVMECQILLNAKIINSSSLLGDGNSWNFTWPKGAYMFLVANSGVNQSSSVWAEIRAVTPEPFNFATGSYYPYP